MITAAFGFGFLIALVFMWLVNGQAVHQHAAADKAHIVRTAHVLLAAIAQVDDDATQTMLLRKNADLFNDAGMDIYTQSKVIRQWILAYRQHSQTA